MQDPYTLYADSRASVLTRLRCLEPDNPIWLHPDTGERVCVPVSTEFADAYIDHGLQQSEWHANWGVA